MLFFFTSNFFFKASEAEIEEVTGLLGLAALERHRAQPVPLGSAFLRAGGERPQIISGEEKKKEKKMKKHLLYLC